MPLRDRCSEATSEAGQTRLTGTFLGVGLAYRAQLHQNIVAHANEIDVLEVLADHYAFGPEDRVAPVDELARTFPVVLHGLGLSIGTAGPLDVPYLKRIRCLSRRVNAHSYSEHLSFTRTRTIETGALLPLPRTHEALEVVCDNVTRVQDFLQEKLLLENVAAYFELGEPEISEPAFIREIVTRTGCGLLLDINNLYANARNLKFDPYEYLANLPLESVRQMHLAGGQEAGGLYVDSHSAPIPSEVWNLYAAAMEHARPDAVIVEWDQDFPAFATILEQLATARELFAQAPG